MRMKFILTLAAVCMLFVVGTASAVTQQAYSGECPQPGSAVANWTCVVTFGDDGIPIRRQGISCDGNSWVDHCPKAVLIGDPNKPSTYYTPIGDSGAWVRFNVSDGGRITEMWGRDAYGIYWQAETGSPSTGDGELD